MQSLAQVSKQQQPKRVSLSALGLYNGITNIVKKYGKYQKDKHRLILWLRNDLRVHDNPVLNFAEQATKGHEDRVDVVPFFCFDPRFYQEQDTRYGTRMSGHVKTRFDIESVAALRLALEKIGSCLLVHQGKPEEVLPLLMNGDRKTTLVYQRECTQMELEIEQAITRDASQGLSFAPLWGSTLLHLDDLPVLPGEFSPSSYTAFCKKYEKVSVRSILPTPSSLPYMKSPSENHIKMIKWLPTLGDLGFSGKEISAAESAPGISCYPFRGGEQEALKRLHEYLFNKKSIATYKQTRNQLEGHNYASWISPWLANGSLSCRYVYHQVQVYEDKYGQNKSTIHFIDELFWRDFFKVWAMAHGSAIFYEYGAMKRQPEVAWRPDQELVARWKEGRTGMPIIDALMRDLAATGFMGNRGRQIVASYFCHDLRQDWRNGAAYFQEVLIDHDVCSNTGGWSAVAGLGPGKLNVFNIALQSTRFDPYGDYIRKWCPELKNIPKDLIHNPWTLNKHQQDEYQVQIHGTHSGPNIYPAPIAVHKYTGQDGAKLYQEMKNKNFNQEIGMTSQQKQGKGNTYQGRSRQAFNKKSNGPSWAQ